MDETGKSLECPFTWGLNEKLVSELSREMFVNSQDQPVKAVIYPVTLVFVYVLKNDLASAYEKMHEAVEHLKAIDQELLGKNKISALVLVHIVRATKYYYFKARGNPSEAQKALISVPELELTQLREKINVGTLNGCKGLSWSVFYNAAPDEFAVSYFRRAILNSPDCPLWHFLLARKLRAVRKDKLSFRPTVEETNNFLKAYELSEKSQYIGAFVAQMYCEKRNLNKAKELCLEIFKSNPNSVGIKLRLSLTFIKIRDFEHAKECLDFVQNECSNNTMYLHYKAIYFEKQNNYKMATLYYQKSAETGNYKCYG
ncbi:uncharacterized protein LOC106642035 [Copidosoma floridanum]|uniref:uncharacterized protein LOC106642035 n=1 Tax=Copidosoma floridanum TaxID=29053 RepID=UPI0006C99A73|nr:uncharacterized protein LOC106642035 [Copidosoma floridanum]